MFFRELADKAYQYCFKQFVWIKKSHSEYIYVNDMVLVTKWYFIMLEDMNPISHQLPRYNVRYFCHKNSRPWRWFKVNCLWKSHYDRVQLMWENRRRNQTIDFLSDAVKRVYVWVNDSDMHYIICSISYTSRFYSVSSRTI